jgi:hypothetical protein
MSKEYREKLKDPRWLAKREELFLERGEQCEWCGAVRVRLTVHHGYYRPKGDPWDYENSSMWILCWPCHEKAQEQLVLAQQIIAHVHPKDFESLFRPLKNAAHEVTYGIDLDEFEAILNEQRDAEANQFSEYMATIVSSSDLGPSIAGRLEEEALEKFPGLETFVSEEESSPDGAAHVEGPEPSICSVIQQWLTKALDRM